MSLNTIGITSGFGSKPGSDYFWPYGDLRRPSEDWEGHTPAPWPSKHSPNRIGAQLWLHTEGEWLPAGGGVRLGRMLQGSIVSPTHTHTRRSTWGLLTPVTPLSYTTTLISNPGCYIQLLHQERARGMLQGSRTIQVENKQTVWISPSCGHYFKSKLQQACGVC